MTALFQFRSSALILAALLSSAVASSHFLRLDQWALRRPAFFRRGGSESVNDTATASITTSDPSPILFRDTTTTTNQSLDTELASNTSHMSNSTTTTKPLPLWKQSLPAVLQQKGNKTLQKINLGAVEIYLLGTAHVSNDSSADVKLLLEAVEPDCIFVELCEARIALLEGEQDEETAPPPPAMNSTKKQDFWDRLDQIRQSQGGSRLQALSTLLLTSVQEDYAETLGVELGGEFRAAHLYWKETCRRHFKASPSLSSSSSSVSLVLGDRPLSLTLVRAWESLWWWPKTKVLAGLLWSSLRKPNPEEIRAWLESVLRDETDVLTTSLQELRQHFPSLYDTIIAERDAWLACKLVQTSRILQQLTTTTSNNHVTSLNQQQQLTQQRKTRLVAIVGAGHVPGIIQWLTNSTKTALSPEQVLRNLTLTKRWANDTIVQKEMIPIWTQEVTQVHFDDDIKSGADWSWAEPSLPPTPP